MCHSGLSQDVASIHIPEHNSQKIVRKTNVFAVEFQKCYDYNKKRHAVFLRISYVKGGKNMILSKKWLSLLMAAALLEMVLFGSNLSNSGIMEEVSEHG